MEWLIQTFSGGQGDEYRQRTSRQRQNFEIVAKAVTAAAVWSNAAGRPSPLPLSRRSAIHPCRRHDKDSDNGVSRPEGKD
jgi:hypothetical protein